MLIGSSVTGLIFSFWVSRYRAILGSPFPWTVAAPTQPATNFVCYPHSGSPTWVSHTTHLFPSFAGTPPRRRVFSGIRFLRPWYKITNNYKQRKTTGNPFFQRNQLPSLPNKNQRILLFQVRTNVCSTFDRRPLVCQHHGPINFALFIIYSACVPLYLYASARCVW